jgi:hypothetical protein
MFQCKDYTVIKVTFRCYFMVVGGYWNGFPVSVYLSVIKVTFRCYFMVVGGYWNGFPVSVHLSVCASEFCVCFITSKPQNFMCQPSQFKVKVTSGV